MDESHFSEDDKKFDTLINVVLWCLGAAVLVLIAELFLVSSWSTRGVIGDWIGGHVAAFAGFATAILLIKQVSLQRKQIRMQREELSLTRKELKLTRDEMSRGREVHEAQKQQLERQAEIAEKAAARSHLLEISKVRYPFLKDLCSMIGANSYTRLCYLVETDWNGVHDKLFAFANDELAGR